MQAVNYEELFARLLEQCNTGIIRIERICLDNVKLQKDFLAAFIDALYTIRQHLRGNLSLKFRSVEISRTSDWVEFLQQLNSVLPTRVLLSLSVILFTAIRDKTYTLPLFSTMTYYFPIINVECPPLLLHPSVTV